nr:hypothetical protein [Tolivirales sp.]
MNDWASKSMELMPPLRRGTGYCEAVVQMSALVVSALLGNLPHLYTTCSFLSLFLFLSWFPIDFAFRPDVKRSPSALGRLCSAAPHQHCNDNTTLEYGRLP